MIKCAQCLLECSIYSISHPWMVALSTSFQIHNNLWVNNPYTYVQHINIPISTYSIQVLKMILSILPLQYFKSSRTIVLGQPHCLYIYTSFMISWTRPQDCAKWFIFLHFSLSPLSLSWSCPLSVHTLTIREMCRMLSICHTYPPSPSFFLICPEWSGA